MSTWHCVRKGWQTLMGSFPLFWGWAGYNLVFALIFLGVIGPNAQPEQFPDKLPAIMVVFFIMIGLWFFLQGGLYSVLSRKIRTDEFSLETFVPSGKKFYWRLTGLQAIATLSSGLLLLITFLLAGAVMAIGNNENPFLNATGLLLMFVLGAGILIMNFAFWLAQCLTVIEDGALMETIKKGFQVLTGRFRQVILIGLVIVGVGALCLVVNYVLTLLFSAVLPKGWALSIVLAIFNSGFNSLLTIFPIAIIITFLYSLATDEGGTTETAPESLPEHPAA